MLAERFKLAEREVQLGIFVGEATEILRRILEILHGGSSFCSYRFDNFEHLGRGFTEIRNTFAREHFTVFARPEFCVPCVMSIAMSPSSPNCISRACASR